TGDGKQITSGFAYWGIAPTVAWAHACNDPYYPVMQQSIESFPQRWRRVRAKLAEMPYHYVSLGVGTGSKDRQILHDLLTANPDLLYMPVDMSAEMLRLGMRESLKGVSIPRRQMVPVQLDFAIEENLVELRRLLEAVVGAEPILFSLLGNTMANFDDDVRLLGLLTRLLRPQDRFLLEVATTDELNDDLAAGAAEEYERSRAYGEFVTSALMHYTDLTINMDNVVYRGSVEGDRALRVKIIYQNRTGGDLRFMLPDRTRVTFPDRDTIRLYLTRKYARRGLDGMLDSLGVRKLHGMHSGLAAHRSAQPFGMNLLLFATGETTAARPPQTSRAEEIWSSYRT
ncbi:MAG TPA: L-histidine N(alpha)-methyltransferase, partial [Micromonosporaceae bacterium]|nr:L-histidine N(alpha)-methyltransferase [Micromonosporaceae bacterium]